MSRRRTFGGDAELPDALGPLVVGAVDGGGRCLTHFLSVPTCISHPWPCHQVQTLFAAVADLDRVPIMVVVVLLDILTLCSRSRSLEISSCSHNRILDISLVCCLC